MPTDMVQRLAPDSFLRGMKVIDVDTHLTEPADLWTMRAPRGYIDRVPRVVKANDMTSSMKNQLARIGWMGTDDNTAVWVVDEDTVLGPAGAGSVINSQDEKVKGSMFVEWSMTEISPAASYVAPRVAMMDSLGIWAQIVYPNVVGFGGQNFSRVTDPELRKLCASLYNDAMADMQEESAGRVCGMALLPWWDVGLCVTEIERVHARGIKGVITNSDPQNEGLPDLADPHWNPVWEACQSLGLPVNFHVGSSATQRAWFGTSPWPSFTDDIKLAIGSSMLQVGNAKVLANLLFSGIFDRFPSLKIVSVESGIGWIPYMLESLDYQAEEANVQMARKPSEYFRSNMYACFWFESGPNFMKDLMTVGVENCMFETDFPHPTCLYPDPMSHVAPLFENADAELRRRVLSDNAATLYKFDMA